jgi:hypothetical protein
MIRSDKTNHPNPKMGDDSVDLEDGWVLGAGVGTSLPVPSPPPVPPAPGSSVLFSWCGCSNLRMLGSRTLNASSILVINIKRRLNRKLKRWYFARRFVQREKATCRSRRSFPPWSHSFESRSHEEPCPTLRQNVWESTRKLILYSSTFLLVSGITIPLAPRYWKRTNRQKPQKKNKTTCRIN